MYIYILAIIFIAITLKETFKCKKGYKYCDKICKKTRYCNGFRDRKCTRPKYCNGTRNKTCSRTRYCTGTRRNYDKKNVLHKLINILVVV